MRQAERQTSRKLDIQRNIEIDGQVLGNITERCKLINREIERSKNIDFRV